MVSKSLTKGLGRKRNRAGCLELGKKGGGRRGRLEPEKEGRVRRWSKGEEMCTGSGPLHGWEGKEGWAPEGTAAVCIRCDLAAASRGGENGKDQHRRSGRDSGRGNRERKAGTIPTPPWWICQGATVDLPGRRSALSNPSVSWWREKDSPKRFVLRERGNSGEITGPGLCIGAMGGCVRAKTPAYSFPFQSVVSEYIQTFVLELDQYQIQFDGPIQTSKRSVSCIHNNLVVIHSIFMYRHSSLSISICSARILTGG